MSKSKMLGQLMLWNLVLSSTKLQRCSKLTWSFVSISDYRRHPSRSKSVPSFCDVLTPWLCQLSLLSSGLPQHCPPQQPSECTHTFTFTHLHIQTLNTSYCSYLYSCFPFWFLLVWPSVPPSTHIPLNKYWRIQIGILSHSNPGKTFFTIVDLLISLKLFIKYQNEAYLDQFIYYNKPTPTPFILFYFL